MNYPICAKNPLLRKLHHRDIDEQAARLTGYEQSYQQISRGHFSGTFTSCELDSELGLYFESTNQVLYQNGAVPDNFYAVGLLMDTAKPLIFNCEALPRGGAFILPPRAVLDGTSSPDMKICVVHVSCELLQQAFQHQYREHRPFRPDHIPYKLVTNARDTWTLHSLLEDFLDGASAGQLSLESANQLAAFKNTLVETIGSLFIAQRVHGRFKIRNKHHRLFHDALDIIEDNLCEELTVGKLCKELLVSRRNLEYIFNENIEMSPAKYIKVLRLNNIRREILTMRYETLGDIAAKWGIWHLGRFARDYYQLFGELPSATKGSVYTR